MGRPRKENADYFSHDSDMRNNRRVQAVRNRFGLEGYATWVMLIEILTASDFFRIQDDEMEMELISADIGIDPDKFNEILSFLIKIKLLIKQDGFIFSESLIERMEPVIKERDKKRNWASNRWGKQRGKKVLDVYNGSNEEFSTSKSMQSKGKESKVKESKVKTTTKVVVTEADVEEKSQDLENSFPLNNNFEEMTPPNSAAPPPEVELIPQNGGDRFEVYKDQILQDQLFIESVQMKYKIRSPDVVKNWAGEFVTTKRGLGKLNHQSYSEFKEHFFYWMNKQDLTKTFADNDQSSENEVTELLAFLGR